MTSRRPMTRSYSGNGRTSSFSEDDGNGNGRSETRNPYLSNVRPENSYSRYSHYRPTRSTLCSVMAQLTEDIQPSFETTLKSKAVSENCNVKFTCVVSGCPPPELKWYKDDMEMDRYCGLPKYEIRKNGKTHTLHIYNCTLDDAAIYQVSASNSKGIVSCSGVLEVGTMSEFQIHQRFFAKLKQKAEKKKTRDSEVQKEDKENVRSEKPQSSPEPPKRKRSVPPREERAAVKEPAPVEQLEAPVESNGVKETAPLATLDSGLENETSPSQETLAKKRIKMTNGVDTAVNCNSGSSSSRNHVMGNGGENCYDGGMSLAQFLAETLQSQAAEEKLNSCPVEKTKEMDTITVGATKEKEKEQEKMWRKKEQEKMLQEEYESEKRREQELVIERERERERQLVAFHTAAYGKHGSEGKHHKGHKDHDHHHIHASISSMFHSVKDFLFGKGKKEYHSSRHSLNENEDQDFDHRHTSLQPPPPEMPPSFQLQAEHTPEVCSPMEVDKPEEPLESVATEPQPVSTEPNQLRNEDSVPHTHVPPVLMLQLETVEQSAGQSMTTAGSAEETMEVFVDPESVCASEEVSPSDPQIQNEAEDKQPEVVSSITESPIRQVPTCSVVLPPQNKQAADEESSPRGESSVLPQADEERHLTSSHTSMEEYQSPTHNTVSVAESLSPGEAPRETPQQEEISVRDADKTCEPDTVEGYNSDKINVEEKAEVKSNQQACFGINQFKHPELVQTTVSAEDRMEPCESERPNKELLPPSTVVARDAKKNYENEDTICTSGVQEMNVDFPTTAVPESSEIGDLKMQRACIVGEETTEGQSVDARLSSHSGFRSSEEVHEWKKVQTGALEKDSERKLSDSERAEEQANAETNSAEVRSESLQFEADKESKMLPVTLSSDHGVISLDKPNNNASRDSSGSLHVWPSENIPSVQISTVDDFIGIKPAEADLSPKDLFIIPKIEIMEPEFKECTLPLTILSHNQQEPTDLTDLINYDATPVSDVTNQDQSVANPPDLLPTQKGVQSDDHLPPTQSANEAAHSDETGKLEQEDTHERGGKQPHQLEYASIPVISVSCSDDKESDSPTSAHMSKAQQVSETPMLPLFVVPPISVTCHESEPKLRLPNHSERMEKETSAQQGTEPDVGNTVTEMPEKGHSERLDLDGVPEKITKENIPPAPSESVSPKSSGSVSAVAKKTEGNSAPEFSKPKPLKESKLENSTLFDDLQKNRISVERLTSKPPTYPALSPASLRKFMSKAAPDTDNETGTNVPVITVGDRQNDKADEDLSGGSTPTSSLSCESSPRMKRRDSLTLIRSATPEELASGARRKIFMPKPKDDVELSLVGALDAQIKKESPYMSPSQARRAALLQASAGQKTPPVERRSPLLARRKATLEVPKVLEEPPTEESVKREEKPAEKKLDPLKAPQVIRKIRGEPFPDASGHLKLWCQFFNVLSDSTIKWYREEEEILEVKRSGGDESQVALAIVLASNEDCGVYGCTISNEYGTDTTDFLLSIDVLSEILLKEDLEVGEEIEMTPLVFAKGLGDSGSWGDKYFGRIMTETVHLGEGCAHKTSKVKVIYGLDPIFESGSSCIIKVQNPIAYGTKNESNLSERNQNITKQECKVQNMIREYCKIFSAEARVNENFGLSLEVIPRYLMYRPANSVPYATVEAELTGDFLKYAWTDPQGKLITQNVSEVEQKCNTFQHWIHQWTHGNLLVTQLQGVEMKITNVRVVTKSKGYQGLTERGSPEVFDQFLTQHQCNYYCGLLGLRPLKSADSLPPSKIKGSRSPLLNRKLGSNSPQQQRKGQSPQVSRKANSSPKVSRKVQEAEDSKSVAKSKPTETPDALEMR